MKNKTIKIKSSKKETKIKHKTNYKHKGAVRCVVKKKTGECQSYDERKIYGSVYAACYVVRMKDKDCESVAEKVSATITNHVQKEKQVTAKHIKNHATKELKKYNKNAAYMYDTHEDIS
jgi:transcriptional regulator NrdR family protein